MKKFKVKKRYIVLILLLIFVILLTNYSINKPADEIQEIIVRNPAVAGAFYPGSSREINSMIEQFEAKVDAELEGKVKALIMPHAGYIYSGQTAAFGFSLLEGMSYVNVILIGGSHTANYKGASIPDVTHYKTPLGNVQVSSVAKELLKEELFSSITEAHAKEHSLEVELPFLQYYLKDFKITPVLIGGLTTKDELLKIADSLGKYVDDKTLIVVSSDFTHYGPNYGYVPFSSNVAKEKLKELDFRALDYILKIDYDGFIDFLVETEDTICGRNAIIVLLKILSDKKIESEVLHYDTSGNVAGDYTNSVSYFSIAFFGEDEGELNEEGKKILLKIARESFESAVKDGKKITVNTDSLPESLTKVQGCFVTLNKNHQLRGCIGHILPQEELYKCVIDNAVNAALNDGRFQAVTEDEFSEIEVDVSVLSVPERLEFSSGEDLLDKLVPLKHGVVLKRGFKQSTYLPQVWEQIPGKEEFLSNLCYKGGMSPECWKDTSTEVYTYTANVFYEGEFD